MKQKAILGFAIWLALLVITGMLAFGHGDNSGAYLPGYGWGHMHRWGENYPAEGMSGWSGMGPEMPGGAAGYGWRGSPYSLPQTMTEAQLKQVRQLHEEAAQVHRALMQQRGEIQTQLAVLYASDKRDWNAIRAATKKLAELQGRQADALLEMQQKLDMLLAQSQPVKP